jgi:hypothetical protein
MTKDEAVAAIGQAMGFPLWQSSGNKIREILDQLDQPQDFTVRELVGLLNQARGMWKVSALSMNEHWCLSNCHTYDTYTGFGISTLKAKLVELATPQPPSDKVTVMMEREMVEWIANYRDGKLADACREALKRTQP